MHIASPYLADGFEWLRGNLHTHTTLSDGELPPEGAIAFYEKLGCGFLAFTDHDCLVAVDQYRSLTPMVLLSGVEVSAHGPHLLGVHLSEPVEPTRDRQRAIDAINALGGFAVLNHPNWLEDYNHWPQEKMETLEGYAGIEIFNGVVEYLEGSALALDRWDRLLTGGKRVCGYANDDLHITLIAPRGWNVVQAADRTPDAVADALRNGRFYASTGVTVSSVTVDGDVVTVDAPDAQCIRFIGMWGREVWRAEGSRARYQVTERAGAYVRAECYGSGMRVAWTQPLFVDWEGAQAPSGAPW